MSATTYLQLKTKISARLKDPQNIAVTAAEVGTVINDAIIQYKKKRFWFNEFKQDVVLVPNDPILPALPFAVIDLFKKDGFVISYSNCKYLVDKILPYQYDAANVEGRGIPYVYTYRDDTFEMYYYPDSDYTATLRGIKDYDDLVNPTDTNDWLTYATDLIMYESLARLFAEFRMDAKMSTYYEGRASDQYKRLIGESNKRNKSGRITVEG